MLHICFIYSTNIHWMPYISPILYEALATQWIKTLALQGTSLVNLECLNKQIIKIKMFQVLWQNYIWPKGRQKGKNKIHPLIGPCWTQSKTFVNCGYKKYLVGAEERGWIKMAAEVAKQRRRRQWRQLEWAPGSPRWPGPGQGRAQGQDLPLRPGAASAATLHPLPTTSISEKKVAWNRASHQAS